MKFILLALIRAYRLILSPDTGALKALYFSAIFNPSGARLGCRHNPSCSEYAIRSINEKGVVCGIISAVRRILMCW